MGTTLELKRKMKHTEGGSREEFSDSAWMYRDGVGKAKVHLELKLVRMKRTVKKSFCKCIASKRKTKENEPVAQWGRGPKDIGHRED